ncbi:hypothetical protein [Pengzhenrongella sp.]|jgi:hypothetical protein|uniref:hypothetical protein n=1 Tax=Pengzhenrongella sp. TaxID=2888820 RepID=UPI002F93F650
MPPTARLRQRLRLLTANDFDDNRQASTGRVELQSICDALQQDGTVVECADDLFDLMERLDHVDLGSPGPLVHALEATSPAYELLLKASLRRKPGPLSVWMVNRILNADRPERAEWLQELTMAADHPRASQQTRRDALEYLRHQAQSGRGDGVISKYPDLLTEPPDPLGSAESGEAQCD